MKLIRVKSLAVYSGGNGHKIKLECHFYVETKNIAHFCCRNNAFALGVQSNTQNSNSNHLTRTLELSFTNPISRVETDVSDVPVQFVRRSRERENTVAWLWKREKFCYLFVRNWKYCRPAVKKWKHWGGVTKKQRQATFRKRLNLLEFKAEHRWILHWNEFLLSTLEFLFIVCVIYAASFLLLVCSFHKLIIDCNVRWICRRKRTWNL